MFARFNMNFLLLQKPKALASLYQTVPLPLRGISYTWSCSHHISGLKLAYDMFRVQRMKWPFLSSLSFVPVLLSQCPMHPCTHASMHPRIQANVDGDHSPQKPWLLARHIFATHITQLCWSFLKVDFFGAKSMSALKIEKFVKLFMVSSVTLWKFVHAPGGAANTFYAKGAI